MPQKIIHKRSSVLNKTPEISQIDYGELLVNYASGATSGDPTAFLSLRRADDVIVKIHEDKYFQDQIAAATATTLTGVTMNGSPVSVSNHVANLGTVITAETQLSKGTVSGTGNAVTDITVSNHQITLVKGATYTTTGDVQNMITADTANYFDGAEYVSSAKTIIFKHGNTTKATIDATDFIKDGMVNEVKIDTPTTGGNSGVSCLVVTFNTDAGKEDIEIPLANIFDPSNYWDSARTQSAITEALQDYYTSAQTDELLLDYLLIGESGDSETAVTYYGIKKALENDELVFSNALIKHNEAAGFNQNGESMLPSGKSLTEAILELSGRTVDLSGYYTSAETDEILLEYLPIGTSADTESAVTYNGLKTALENDELVFTNALIKHNTSAGFGPDGESLLPNEMSLTDAILELMDEVENVSVEYSVNDKLLNAQNTAITLDGTDVLNGSAITYSGVTLATSADTVTDTFNALLKELIDDEYVISQNLNTLKDSIGLGPNGESLLPDGVSLTEAINELSSDKQDTLISGTNIKTINGNSLLGSGNITIEGGGTGSSVQVENVLTSTSTTNALSANMGKSLNDTLTAHTSDTTVHVTAANKTTWNGKQDAISDLTAIRNNASSGASAYTNVSNLSASTTAINATLTAHTANTSLHKDTKNTVGNCRTMSSDDQYFYVGVDMLSTDTSSSYENRVSNKVFVSNDKLYVNKDGLNPAQPWTHGREVVVFDDLESAISAFTTSAAVETQITGKNYVTSASVESQITGKNYTTSAAVETQITNKHYTTSAAVETQITGKNYTTSAAVETQITNKHYITSGDAKSQIEAYGYTANAGTITGINMNGASKGTSGVVDLGTVITAQTQLSKGTTSGTGNAVTDINVSNHQITLVKGATYTTSGDVNSQITAITSGKQDTISDLSTIRNNAASGASAYTNAITGVTAGGTNVVSNKVAAIPTASTNTFGVIKTGNFLTNNAGTISVTTGTNSTSVAVGNHSHSNYATTSTTTSINNTLTAHTGDTTVHLPSVSSTDNGKILMVVNGTWTLVSPTVIYSGSGTPDNNQGNNGDIYLQTS